MAATFYSIKTHLLDTAAEIQHVQHLKYQLQPLNSKSVFINHRNILMHFKPQMTYCWPHSFLIIALIYISKLFPDCLWVPSLIYLNPGFQERKVTADPCKTKGEWGKKWAPLYWAVTVNPNVNIYFIQYIFQCPMYVCNFYQNCIGSWISAPLHRLGFFKHGQHRDVLKGLNIWKAYRDDS